MGIRKQCGHPEFMHEQQSSSTDFIRFPWISGVGGSQPVAASENWTPALEEAFTRSQLAAFIVSSMLAAGLAGWLASWLLAASQKDDEEDGFQGLPTRSSLEQLGGLVKNQ